eukprot:m.189302 g.189302  ORF g.189302 m.189302 type:complete len:53 (+) comp15106_c0_seq2:764-922(+)
MAYDLNSRIYITKNVDFVPDILGILSGLEYIHGQGMIRDAPRFEPQQHSSHA